jgi:hypothetical protein
MITQWTAAAEVIMSHLDGSYQRRLSNRPTVIIPICPGNASAYVQGYLTISSLNRDLTLSHRLPIIP